MESVPVNQTKLRTAQMMTPDDANFFGKVFGGSILSLIDLCAAATASRFAGNMCVTASFDRVDFHQPVEIGELVELDGMVTYVGRTSMEVTIDVHATNLLRRDRRHVNTARVTMVAMKDGKPVAVPRLICETREEKVLFLTGRLRRELKAARTELYEEIGEKVSVATDSDIDRLLASTDPLLSQLT